MKKSHINAHGRKYEHLSIARSKLNRSAAQVRGMCSREELVCIQAGGSWYVDSASLYKGVRLIQENRVKKEIMLSKLRKTELSTIKTRSKSAKRIVGSEIRLRRGILK